MKQAIISRLTWIDGSWDKVEKDADGGEIDNRLFTFAADDVVNITVEKWADQ